MIEQLQWLLTTSGPLLCSTGTWDGMPKVKLAVRLLRGMSRWTMGTGEPLLDAAIQIGISAPGHGMRAVDVR